MSVDYDKHFKENFTLSADELTNEYLGEPKRWVIAREQLKGKSKLRANNRVKYVNNVPETAKGVFKPCS